MVRAVWVKVVVLQALKLGLSWAFLLVLVLGRATHHVPSDATISDDAAYMFLLSLS